MHVDAAGIHILFGQAVVNDSDFAEVCIAGGVGKFRSVSDDQVVQLEVVVDVASVVDHLEAIHHGNAHFEDRIDRKGFVLFKECVLEVVSEPLLDYEGPLGAVRLVLLVIYGAVLYFNTTFSVSVYCPHRI